MEKIVLVKQKRLLEFAAISINILSILLLPATAVADAGFYSDNNVLFYSPGASSCSITSSPSPSSPGGKGKTITVKFSLSQVETFAGESIKSTWNISNSTVEQWFLKQAGAQATISKYGLNPGNIGAITSAVQAAGVSPVFFYLYTVNEGGGAGGFINHYSGDVAGGGPANATRDAQYLVTQSQQTKGSPAIGGGEPVGMPTAEAQSILSSLPSGSIGVVYIQATAAVTAELEDLSGKTGAWTGLYNMPLSDAMQNIQNMGGDPMQGGSSIGCAGGLSGTGIVKAMNWAKMIANNNGYGYDQPTRTSGWAKWQSDPGCTTACGSFDCSSFISAALTVAGYFPTNPEFVTTDEGSYLQQAGFTKLPAGSYDVKTDAGLQPGDILVLTSDHTEMYLGNNQNVGAHINENHGISGGQVGDQSGDEIAITPYYDDNWDAVYRASK